MSKHNRNSRWVALLALVFTAVLVGSVNASTLTVPVTAHAVVASDSGDTRILVDFGALDQLAGKRILYAKCYLDIGASDCGDAPDALIDEVEVRLMSEDWDAATVSFEATLEAAPLAEKATSARHAGLQRGESGMTEILLTEFVQAWVDGEVENHGLLLLLRIPGCEYELRENRKSPTGAVGELLVRCADSQE